MDGTAAPLILAEVKRQLSEAVKAETPAVVLDVPLLFEAGWDELAEESWLVYVPEDEQLRRLCIRDKCTEEQGLRRMKSQMSLREKLSRADVAIDNSGMVKETERVVRQLWKERVHEQFT